MANKQDTISQQLEKQKVAIYIRVSTHWQIDKDSLKVQRRELIAYTEMVLGINDYVVFEDPGFSAKNTDRPDFQKMMSRLRTGEFSHLLVWKIDRISRNLLDFSTMYNELKKLGVTFISKNEQFDTSNAIGEAMLKIILVFAELERNMTAERVTAVMLSRANNGQWNGGHIPYGYKYDKETQQFSVNEKEAKVVSLIYSRYIQYRSIIGIARYLNEHGVNTKKGKPWNAVNVHHILTSPFYIGTYRYNTHDAGVRSSPKDEKEWITIDDHHEAIISREDFDKVQFILKRNRRGNVSDDKTYVKKNIHIFAGLVKCGICGSNMSATLDRVRADGWRPSIYGCSKRRSSTACTNKYVSDITLGPFIFNYVANIIRAKNSVKPRTTIDVLERRLLRGEAFKDVEHIDSDSLLNLLDLLQSGKTGLEYAPALPTSENTAADERKILEDRRRKCETALNRLQSLYLFGDENIAEKDFVVKRKELSDELAEINSQLSKYASLDSDSAAMSDSLIQKAAYFFMIEKISTTEYIDFGKLIKSVDEVTPRNFINSIISKIVVTKGRVVSILFTNGMEHKFTYKTSAPSNV